MNTYYKIAIAYLLAAVAVATQTTTIVQLGWVLLGLLLVAALHLAAYAIRREKIEWGAVTDPIAVVDWGTDGQAFTLPEHLAGQYIACAAVEVQGTLEATMDKLTAASNYLYIKNGLPVYGIYFRYGERCNETMEQYKEHVTQEMNDKRVTWHSELAASRPDYYLETFIRSLRNGSRAQ
jgi:hypothetical protein